MATSETGLVTEFADQFKVTWPNGYWRKLHGGMYQAGLPDVICAIPAGDTATGDIRPSLAAMLEFKWLPTNSDGDINKLQTRGISKLTALQRYELGRLYMLCLSPILVIGSPEYAVVLDWPGGTNCLRFQRKARGEHWNLNHLLWNI
jgi:hypothetical protein